MTRAEFLGLMVDAATHAARDGAPIHPQATAAHAAVESAYGTSGLATRAFNVWGVKATGIHTPWWDGASITMPTWEVVDGKNVTVQAAFRAYASWQNAIRDYGDIISRVYPNAVAGKDRDLTFLAGLFLTGPRKWATDPAAFDKSARVIAQYASDLYTPDSSEAWGEASTLVLHNLRIAERWVALTQGPAVLRGRYVWRLRGHKLDVRKA